MDESIGNIADFDALDESIGNIVDYEALYDVEVDKDETTRLSENDHVFSFTGIFFQRFYRSQLRPKEWTRALVYGDTKDEIVDCLLNGRFYSRMILPGGRKTLSPQ
ncbi:uncharacterized protein LOC129718846 [Wyeomyia smithii]|uniref:uncharacterized protein LOC129718846 n=1 Tax=Wyeomyia smithii TaxID=174621 RepID=UPI002467E220|nr:uncharacterized protein LOC129718846 [Wyeomyia smithii]